MTTPKPETPELDKQLAAQAEARVISQFYDWLCSHGIVLARYDEDRDEFFPHNQAPNNLLADYFEIDLNKAEAERIAILERLRANHAQDAVSDHASESEQRHADL